MMFPQNPSILLGGVNAYVPVCQYAPNKPFGPLTQICEKKPGVK